MTLAGSLRGELFANHSELNNYDNQEVAVARQTIPVLIDEAADIGPIPTAPYAPSASQELADAASSELAKGRNAVLLANHGVVVVGRDLREAARRALEVERLAKIYIGAALLGGAQALDEAQVNRSLTFFETYRAAPVISYSFRAGITFASLLQSLILQKLHR